jgi:plastocyanin
MELIQTVSAEVAADSASGIIAELEAHRAELRARPGFRGMSIIRTAGADGMVVTAETRWRDATSLSEYAAQAPNAESIIRGHGDEILNDSLVVRRGEALTDRSQRENAVFERFSFSLFVPVGVLAIGLAIIYGLSRIYLAVPSDAATVLAAIVALGILGVCAFLAANPVVSRTQIATIVGIVAVVLAGGATYAGVQGKHAVEIPESLRGETPTAAPSGGPSGALTVVGKNVKFEQTSLQASAGQVTIQFENQDSGVPHNIHFFKGTDATGDSVGATDVHTGPATDTLTLTLDEGTYFYHCDIHPTTMTGTLTVGPAQAGGGGGGGAQTPAAGGGGLTVTGENIKFDPTSLQASAGSVTVTFDNKDNGVPHNIHFFKGTDASGESVAATDVKSGPATDTLTMNLEAGTYFYHCDIHPTTMKGTLTVQ